MNQLSLAAAGTTLACSLAYALPAWLFPAQVAETLVHVEIDGRPRAGAEVFAVTGPFPGLAPLVDVERRRAVTDGAGRARLRLPRALHWSVWASWRSAGQLWASRMSASIVPGRKLALRLRPFGSDRFELQGTRPWRAVLGERLTARFVANGPVAASFDVVVPASGVVPMPPLPHGSFVAGVVDGPRPADWVECPAQQRILQLARPLAVSVANYVLPVPGRRRVFFLYGRAYLHLTYELGAEDRTGIWLSERPDLLRHGFELRAFDARVRDQRGTYRIRPGYRTGIRAYERKTRQPRRRIFEILNAPDRPRADREVWVGVGRGLARWRTDERGQLAVYGKQAIYIVENGRGARIFPSVVRDGTGAALAIDLSRRQSVELRTTTLSGEPLPHASVVLDGLVTAPTDGRGRRVVRLMPGLHKAVCGTLDGRLAKRFVLRNPGDAEEAAKEHVAKQVRPFPVEVRLWRMIDVDVRAVMNGRPLAEATVDVRGAARGTSRPGASIWYGATDESGRFRCRVPDYPAPVELRFRKRSGKDEFERWCAVDVSELADNLVIDLAKVEATGPTPHGPPADRGSKKQPPKR